MGADTQGSIYPYPVSFHQSNASTAVGEAPGEVSVVVWRQQSFVLVHRNQEPVAEDNDLTHLTTDLCGEQIYTEGYNWPGRSGTQLLQGTVQAGNRLQTRTVTTS